MKQTGSLNLKLIRQSRALKRPLPDDVANPPQVFPWLEIFFTAFHDLMWDRADNLTPIQWTTRQAWAKANGLDHQATYLLHHHLREMDTAFMGWLKEKRSKSEQ